MAERSKASMPDGDSRRFDPGIPPDEERRGLERRVDMLEKLCTHIQAGMQRVEMQQERAREVLDSRYEATSKGQDMITAEIKHLTDKVNDAAGLKTQLGELNATVKELVGLKDKISGAISLITYVGIGVIIVAGAVLIRAFAVAGGGGGVHP